MSPKDAPRDPWPTQVPGARVLLWVAACVRHPLRNAWHSGVGMAQSAPEASFHGGVTWVDLGVSEVRGGVVLRRLPSLLAFLYARMARRRASARVMRASYRVMRASYRSHARLAAESEHAHTERRKDICCLARDGCPRRAGRTLCAGDTRNRMCDTPARRCSVWGNRECRRARPFVQREWVPCASTYLCSRDRARQL